MSPFTSLHFLRSISKVKIWFVSSSTTIYKRVVSYFVNIFKKYYFQKFLANMTLTFSILLLPFLFVVCYFLIFEIVRKLFPILFLPLLFASSQLFAPAKFILNWSSCWYQKLIKLKQIQIGFRPAASFEEKLFSIFFFFSICVTFLSDSGQIEHIYLYQPRLWWFLRWPKPRKLVK